MATEYWILLLLAGFVLVLMLIKFIWFLHAFGKDLAYFNAEIKRCSPGERARWRRARRRLWLSLIPFYRPKRKTHRKS